MPTYESSQSHFITSETRIRLTVLLFVVALISSVLFIAPQAGLAAGDDEVGRIVLPGVAGNYVSAGSFSSGTRDLEFVFYAGADDWSTGQRQVLMSRWPRVSADNTFIVQIGTAGQLQLVVKRASMVDNVFAATAEQLGLTDGAGSWLRIRFDAANVANATTTFWSSSDPADTAANAVSWGTAANVDDIAGQIILNNGNGIWQIGARGAGDTDMFAGAISYARVYTDGWSGTGTKAAELDFRTTAQASTVTRPNDTWDDAAGHTWTVHGTAWTYESPGTQGALLMPGVAGNYVSAGSFSSGTRDLEFVFYAGADD